MNHGCAVRAPRRPRRGRRLSAAASALLGPGPRRARHGRPPPQADQDQSRRRQAIGKRKTYVRKRSKTTRRKD